MNATPMSAAKPCCQAHGNVSRGVDDFHPGTFIGGFIGAFIGGNRR
jgi:hypothetical protein